MRVFVTGATGWVGSAVVQDLIGAGHRVVGLVRSEDKAARLAATGATVLRGTLEDLDTLRSVASTVDAIIHTAFNHDFSRFAEGCEQDRRVIEALGSALAGSSRPLLVTSGLLGLPKGASETDQPSPASPRKSEPAARALAEGGVRAATIRLAPSVHGIGDWGFVPMLIRIAREKGVSAFLGEGSNCWAAVHRQDAARVYRLALEQSLTEPVYHAVAEEAVSFRVIAQAIGDKLGLPVESRDREHFGWLAHFAGAEMSATSARTRELLGWMAQGPTLLSELNHPDYV
jgi:nucleoside-diphosphate-sugar epimerase